MNRFVRVALVILLIVALVTAAGLAALLYLTETDLVRTSVQDQLTKLSGQNVSLGSLKVSYAFPRLVHLKMEGISVRTPEGEELFAADRVVFSPALGPLLRRRLDIESILVDRFRIAVIRQPDGAIRSPLVPVALPRHPGEKPATGPAPSSETVPPTSAPPTVLNWSLRRFQLTDGSVNWVDRCVIPGKDTMISITALKAELTQQNPSAPIGVKASGKMGTARVKESEIRIEGSLTGSPDRTAIEQVSLSIAADPLDPQLLRAYVPDQAAEGGFLDPIALQAQCAWQKSNAPVVEISLSARQKAEPFAQVSAEGKIALAVQWPGPTHITFSAASEGLPMKLFRGLLPPRFPLEPTQGVVKGSVQGKCGGGDDWIVHCKLEFDDGELRGPYRVMGKPIRAAFEADLSPAELSIGTIEITVPPQIATAKGRVSKPFDESREFDLTTDAIITPALAQALGVKLPEGFLIEPAIPVRGRVWGTQEKIQFDLAGNLTDVAMAFKPFVEKLRGQRGSVSAKGTWLLHVSGTKQPRFDAAVSVNAAGIAVRPMPTAPGLSGLLLSAGSKLTGSDGKVDLKDATLKLKRSAQGPDFLNVTGSMAGLGSSDATVKGAGTVALDAPLLQALGVPPTGDVTLKGGVPLTGKVDGTLTALSWTVDVPLTNLDIQVRNTFRKPAGLQASATAALRISGREIKLVSGQIKTGGCSFSAQGVLADRDGNFGEVFLETKRANIERLLPLFPEFRAVPLSGPIDAAMRLTRTDNGISPTGSVHLAAINHRPDKAHWSLEDITGTIYVKGDSVDIPEISGRLAGVIQGPFSVKGALKEVGSPATMNGALSVDVGKGRIKADSLLGFISQARVLAETLVSPQTAASTGDLRDFNYLKGDITIASGYAKSYNLRLKGADISLGSIGSLKLDSSLVDMIVGVRTAIPAMEALGKIGPLRQLIDRNRDFLKATGIDRELQRMGIKLPSGKEESSSDAPAAKPATTVIVRLRGPIATPQVTPVLETSLGKDTAAQLKSLLE
ncbi:MAG: DUF748 domain-containing protein [Desulfomonile sp.]|nr:DUF748 domain-containing protein [Desulfomonile sp.]